MSTNLNEILDAHVEAIISVAATRRRLKIPVRTIWAQSSSGWVTFQSVESPNSRPPAGQPENDQPNLDTPPAVRLARRIR
jgi:hypothetical protein